MISLPEALGLQNFQIEETHDLITDSHVVIFRLMLSKPVKIPTNVVMQPEKLKKFLEKESIKVKKEFRSMIK